MRLAGDTVVWGSHGGSTDSTVVRRVPSAADWRAFWRTVDAIGLRSWPASCNADPLTAVVYGFAGVPYAVAL